MSGGYELKRRDIDFTASDWSGGRVDTRTHWAEVLS